MRTIRWALILAGLVLLVSVPFVLTQETTPGNLLENPGFDTGDPIPTGWTPEKKAAQKGAVRISPTRSPDGSRVLELLPNQRNEPSAMTNNPLGVGQAIGGGRVRGKRVYIGGYLGASREASAVAGLYALRIGGRVEQVELRQSDSGENLQYLTEMLDVPNDPRILFLIVNLHAEGRSGTARFSKMYVGLTPPPAPAPPDGARSGPDTTRNTGAPDITRGAGSLKAEVAVDAAREIRRIPEGIYGTNLEWIRNGNGIVDPKSGDLNPQLVSLTRDLQPTLLRFPGGIFADFYHWKDGIGPRVSRRSARHMPGSNDESPNTFATDEALEFSRRVAAPLMITVNIATGTPAEAAEWFQYIRARTGAGKAPPVTYWEIGNENYGKGDTAYLKAAGMTPDAYVRRFNEFARALKDVDGSVRVGAIAEENYGRRPPLTYPNWTQKVLEGCSGLADFISVHNGYAPLVLNPSGVSLRDVYAAMWAAPRQIARNLADLERRIAAGNGRGRIQIAVTEWGPLFHLLPSSPYVDHVKTLGSALYVASTLKVFAESPGVEAAALFKLVDPLFMGSIGLRRGEFAPTASYYALQMYRRHFGEVLVESSTNVPAYRNRQVGHIDTESDNPYVEAVASRSADGKKLYVLMINRSFDQDVPTTVRLTGFRAGGGTAWILSGTGVDANTGTQLPAGVNWARQAADEQNPRFERGGPDEITIRSQPLPRINGPLEYVLPRLSVVSLEADAL